MQNLIVSIIQTPLFWENKERNLDMFSRKIDELTDETDIIVLPEMFTTGFSMKSQQFAEKTEGETLKQMQQWAKEKNCVVTGSIIVGVNTSQPLLKEEVSKEKEGSLFSYNEGNSPQSPSLEGDGEVCYHNRLLWIRPDGSYETYDKRHLFRFAGENKHYIAGTEKLIVELKGWKICPLICFDLRFPVWSRNVNQAYDCLIYIANWPQVRSAAWSTLLQARAHENQCYVVGVNRIGEDGNGINHSGNSVVITPKGEVISKTKPNEEKIETTTLSWSDLNEFRKKFPVAKDADEFEIKTD